MEQMRLLLGVVMGLLITAGSPAGAADRHVEILDFYVYPDETPRFNKLAGYVWPEVKALNALVEVDVGGYTGEQKIDLFMVVLDEEEEVVSKLKGKHWLPTGGHELLFEWRASSDAFDHVAAAGDPDGLRPYVDFVRRLVEEGETDTRAVRRKVVEFYRRAL